MSIDERACAGLSCGYKPRILLFVRYYLPGYLSGGPVRTIANLVDKLGDEFQFLIVTSDRDAGQIEPYPGVKINRWNSVGKTKVFYASPGWLKFKNLIRLVRVLEYDLVYINTFYHPIFGCNVLLVAKWLNRYKKPILLAPRGQLAFGARSTKSIRKFVYIRLLKSIGLLQGVYWQASSKYEADDIRKVIGHVASQIIIAPDLATTVNNLDSGCDYRDNGDILRIIFLARITPVKNLDIALRVLSKVRVPVEFSIYGPIDVQLYWERCCQLIDDLPNNVVVTYEGSVSPENVPEVLAKHDLFFLPTRGENYGHAIAESLAAGTPVLISNTTPWEMVNDRGVGWTVPLDKERLFVECIHNISKLSSQERQNLRKKVLDAACEMLVKEEDVEANRSLFKQLCIMGQKKTKTHCNLI